MEHQGLSKIAAIFAFTLCAVGHRAAAAQFVNGSFESGLTGWTYADLASPHVNLAVRTNGYNSSYGFFSTTATQGTSSLSWGFDGGGPGTISFAQDVGVIDPASSLLTFDYRVAWDMLSYGGAQDRIFSVVIRPAGGGAALATYEIVRAPSSTQNLDSGPLSASIWLGAFSGSNVRISFENFIPQSFTGPGFMQVDNAALAVPEPSIYALVSLAVGLFGWTYLRRRSA